MTNKPISITFIKTVHSLIWAIMALAIFYILYCGISGNLSTLLYYAIGIIIFETTVLLINHWSCPFTIMAKKAKPDWKDGDDIFLPKWIAINNKMIFGTLFVIGVALVIYRLF